MTACRLFLLLLLAVFFSSHSYGQSDFFSDINVTSPANNTSSSAFSVLGWLTEKIDFGLENPGTEFTRQDKEVSKVETSLFTQLDWRIREDLNLRVSGKAYHDEIYRINNDTPYSRAERNKFRNRFEIKDLYIEKKFDNDIYLKVGNQILAWGFAEHLRVTDIINTEDQFTFGQQDLEDLRLQVPGALLSVSAGDWVLDGVITHRAGYNDMAPAGDEFDQFIALSGGNRIVDRISPDDQFEYFLRASSHYKDGDVQIVAGEFNNNQLTLDGIDRPRSISPVFQFSQQRMQAVGVAANRASGSWLMYGELGMHFNSPVMPQLEDAYSGVNGWGEKDQILGVIGAEYNGFSNTIISLETDSIHTRNYSNGLQMDRNQLSFGTRVYWTGWNERLKMLSVWNKLSDSQGYVSRVSMDYDWTDNLSFGVLWVDYNAERNSMYYNYRNNDILQLNMRFSFQN